VADQRDLTQLVVETDVLQTHGQRQLLQIVIEVDSDNWGFVPIPPSPPQVYLGRGIILLVNTGTWSAPVFEPLAEQRVVDFGEGSEPIDWSSKDSRFRRIMPGR